MEKRTMYPELVNIENEIDRLLLEEGISNEKEEFYKALRTVINLKTDSEEINHKFDQIHEVLTAVAVGDFTHRIDVPNRKNLFYHLGISINAVVDELQNNVVKQQYLETTLEYIPHIAIITDKNGTIQFANSAAYKTLGKSKEDIIKLRIANLFESKSQFGVLNPDFQSLRGYKVTITLFDHSLKANLTIKEILNKFGQIDGYLYIAKPL